MPALPEVPGRSEGREEKGAWAPRSAGPAPCLPPISSDPQILLSLSSLRKIELRNGSLHEVYRRHAGMTVWPSEPLPPCSSRTTVPRRETEDGFGYLQTADTVHRQVRPPREDCRGGNGSDLQSATSRDRSDRRHQDHAP